MLLKSREKWSSVKVPGKRLETARTKQEHNSPALVSNYCHRIYASLSTCFRKYSAEADPLAPELKLSTNLHFQDLLNLYLSI